MSSLSVILSCVSCVSLTNGLADVGNSSVGNSDTVAHQTMSDNTTMGDAMSNDTTVSDAMSNTNDSGGEGSSAIVSDFGNISINVVGVEVDGVVALPGSGAIVRLLGVETGSRVVVSHSILVGVGGDLVRVDFHSVGHRVGDSMAHYSMPDSNSMANTHSMANAHSVAKANTMANSSKKLSRGSSHKSGDRNESLHLENCCHTTGRPLHGQFP